MAPLGELGVQSVDLPPRLRLLICDPRLLLGESGLLAGIEDREPGHDHQRGGRRAEGAGQPGVPLAPAPGPLCGRNPTRPDRPVVEEPPQVLGQLGGGGVAPRRLAGHRLEHDRLQVARDPRVDLPRPGRVLVQHLVDQHGPIGVGERRPAGGQLVEGDPQPVDVGPRVAPAREPLRRHVAQRPQQVAGVGQRLGVGRVVRQAEVGDPDGAPLVEQDVRRLDVAVDDRPGRARRRRPRRPGATIRATSR